MTVTAEDEKNNSPLFVLFVCFSAVTLELLFKKKKKKTTTTHNLGTIFLWGRWPSRPPGTVKVCRVVVVFVLHASLSPPPVCVCAPRYPCSGVKCVLSLNLNETNLIYFTWLSRVTEFVCVNYLPITGPSICFYNIYYALLFYIPPPPTHIWFLLHHPSPL